MSFQDVIAKMDRLERKIDQMLKDNTAIYIEIAQLKKRLDAIEPVAKQAAKDSGPMRVISGYPVLRSNNSNKVRELIAKGKTQIDNSKKYSGESGPGVGDGSDPKNCTSLPIVRQQPTPKTAILDNKNSSMEDTKP